MCGIAGYIAPRSGFGRATDLCVALDKIAHRGPDDAGLSLISRDGTAVDYAVSGTEPSIVSLNRLEQSSVREHDIGLGHRRFSIIDTSTAGHQPFWAEDRRICVSFNGEIYNYVETRDVLRSEGYKFNTTSDTEVLVQAYRAWGVDCFERLNGFWAAALYDARKNKLLLARDRIGKAPLYVCRARGGLYWSSEIKGLLAMLPEEVERIDEQSFFDFANWQRKDIDDRTSYRNIKTFPRASYAWIDNCGGFTPKRYWALPRKRLNENQIGVNEASEEFRSIISDAVRIRLRADVPVASQLSGGMDSTTLLALACGVKKSIDTYTVKFAEPGSDEEPYARLVAQMYEDSVNYHVIEPPSADLIDDIESYTSHMEAPYHSPNQFTNQRIWQTMSRKGLRVVLYGAGGDETFAGYGSEYFAPYLRLLLRRGKVGAFAKEFFLSSESSSDTHMLGYARTFAKLVPGVPTPLNNGRIRFVKSSRNPLRLDQLSYRTSKPPSEFNERLVANMQDWRMNYWLRTDNQNSMGVPIELRSPFLDHRLVEFAFQLPETYLIRDGWMKWIIRHSMKDMLPKEVVWRRQKMGFPFPLSSWLKNYKDTFRHYMDDVDCPYIDMRLFQDNYEYLAGRHPDYTWGLLSLMLWWRSIR